MFHIRTAAAASLAALILASVPACSPRIVEGEALGPTGLPASSSTRTIEPDLSEEVSLPEELKSISPLGDTNEMTTRQLVMRVAANAERVIDALGIDVETPPVVARPGAIGCVSSGHVAGVCGGRNVLDYNEPEMESLRERLGDLAVVEIISHEMGHLAARLSGNDGPDVPDEIAESRASCVAGIYTATYQEVVPADAATVYMSTPLNLAGRTPYTAFTEGFDKTRAGQNSLQACVTYS